MTLPTCHSTDAPRWQRRSRTPITHAGLILLKGGVQESRHDTDTEIVFRQESYFNWAFGVAEPEWLGAIDIATGKNVMFMPRLDPDDSAWIGRIKVCDYHTSCFFLGGGVEGCSYPAKRR